MNRNTLTIARFAVACAIWPMACGSTKAPQESAASTESAIGGGALDSSHSFAVGMKRRAGGGLCSGTLIAPNLVLTARHCVADSTGGDLIGCTETFLPAVAPEALIVTTDATMNAQTEYYDVSHIEEPSEDLFCGNDIVLLILQKNVPFSDASPATPVVGFSMTEHDRVAPTIAAIGYGTTKPGVLDGGHRRLRRNLQITCIPGDSTVTCATGESDSPREFVTEGGTCAGDSGGGAYEQASLDRNTPYVMGVLSRALEAGDACIDSAYTRTDSFAPLILAAARKAAQSGGYPLPSWAEDVPPDAGPAATNPTRTPKPDAAAARASTPDENGASEAAPSEGHDGCQVARVGLIAPPAERFTLLLFAGVALILRRRTRDDRDSRSGFRISSPFTR